MKRLFTITILSSLIITDRKLAITFYINYIMINISVAISNIHGNGSFHTSHKVTHKRRITSNPIYIV